MGQPIVVTLQVVDCTGALLQDIDLSGSSAVVSSLHGHVLLRHETLQAPGGAPSYLLHFPDLVIDTAGYVALTFALTDQVFPWEVASVTVEIDVYQGVWWKTEATLSGLANLGGSTAVLVGNRVVIFGGVGPQGAVQRLAEYNWRLDSVAIVQPFSSWQPPKLFGHAACGQGSVMWVYGGKSSPSSQILGGLYRYTPVTHSWEDWSNRPGQPLGILAPVLVSNSSALVLLDRRSSVVLIHILNTDSIAQSNWINAALLAVQPFTSMQDAVMAINSQGSTVVILSNTTLFSYVLATDTWNQWTISAISAGGNIFSSCHRVGSRLMLVSQRHQNLLTHVQALELPNALVMSSVGISSNASSFECMHAQCNTTCARGCGRLHGRSSPIFMHCMSMCIGQPSTSGVWVRITDVSTPSITKFSKLQESSVSLVALSDTHLLVIGGPISPPWQVI